MKQFILPAFITATFLFGAVILTTSFKADSAEDEEVFPKEVKTLIENSCFECHTTGSQNEDAKEELDFKKFDELGKVRKITKLKAIAEMVEEDEMPPGRYLEKKPDKALTSEQKEIIINWAQNEMKTLIGN